MACKYKHLLSPVKIGNRVLKNRMVSTPSGMHLNRGNEAFPTETLFAYYEGKARNGAAMMTVNGMTYRAAEGGDGASDFDILKRGSRQALAKLVNGIQMYGCLATANMHMHLPEGYDVCGGIPNQWLSPHGMEWGTRVDLKTAPAEMLLEYAELYSDYIAMLKTDCGFDGVFLHMAYRMMPLGRFLSPLTNQRDDEYGGNLENQFRYPKLIADLIKKKCGPEFIVEASISGCDPAGLGGLTTDDVAAYVKMAQGSFDVLQIKAPELDPAHPIPFELRKTPWLDLCGEIKQKSGGVVPLMTVGGYSTPELAETALASEKADLVGMARSWISNPDWVQLMYEGREDDIIPCLRCNKCHRSSESDPMIPVCSVNPAWGIEHQLPRIIKMPKRAKKIGIVGGGPAGLRAAIMLSDRGHAVTVYEEKSILGGQLEITKDVPFKWTLQDYKHWLIEQVKKRPVDVKLDTKATKEMLREAGYEEILICVGAEPLVPSISGINAPNVMTYKQAYEHPESVGQRVVIVGGGEIGAETGIYFAQKGHLVSVIEMRRLLAMDSTPIHYYSMFRAEWEKLSNFIGLTECVVTEIGEESVTYQSKDGASQRLPYDTVILAAGMRPLRDQALSLCVEGVKCHLIGDCDKIGNIQKLNRTVFGLTSSI